MEKTTPFAFTSTRCVLSRCAPATAPLAHVVALVDALLDPSDRFDLASAARVAVLRLFEHVAQRIDAAPVSRDRSYKYAKAMSSAIAAGSLAIVEAIHRRHPEPLDGSPMRTAARCGQVEIFAWLYTFRHDDTCAPLPPAQYPPGSLKCCKLPLLQVAIDTGHPRVVRWLTENGYTPCKDTRTIASEAASQGDLETIQWLHETNSHFTTAAMDSAARHGHLEVIKFLHEHREEGCSSTALIYAIVYVHDDVAAYLQETKLCTQVNEDIILAAASAGRVDLLEQYGPVYANGGDSGSVKVLRRALTSALMAQRLEVLQWLYSEKRVTGMPVAMAISHEPVSLELIQWIHDNECGHWTEEVLKHAIEFGHATLVQWLHVNGRDICREGGRTWMIAEAAGRGHLEVIQTLHELYPNQAISSEFAMDRAATGGHLDVLKWLREHRGGRCTPQALSNAIIEDHREVARWLFEHYSEHRGRWGDVDSSMEEVEQVFEQRDRARSTGVLDGEIVTERQRRERIAHATISGHLHRVQRLAGQFPESFNRDEVQRTAEGARQPHIVAWIQTLSREVSVLPAKPPARQSSIGQRLERGREGGIVTVADHISGYVPEQGDTVDLYQK